MCAVCILPSHLELVMSSALFPVRCIWAPATRSHPDFPLLTTPSSHPPNPQACQSFLLSQSAPTSRPNCWGRSRPFPHSCLCAACDSELYVCVCVSQLSGPDCPRGWQGRLPYVQCVLGPSFTGPSERRVKMAVYNTMKPVLLNNIFASIEGKIEPGTSRWVFVSRGSADGLLNLCFFLSDHYIIVGAQRDSWGPGAVKSGVGTALLMELARTFSNMVENGKHSL